MWELDLEDWALKNSCFQTVLLEKTLESSLDRKEIKPVSPKGNQPWIFIGRTDAKAESPVLCPSDLEKWASHLLSIHIFRLFSLVAQPPWRRQWHPTPVLLPGKCYGWRSLVGCSPWGHEESDTTERLHFHISLSCIGEGNGNPLQCSCLENPRNGEAWWAAIYGVTQSRTRLKRLSSSSSSSSTTSYVKVVLSKKIIGYDG